MNDALDKVIFYQKSLQLWELFWKDSEVLMADVRGRELARQLTRSVDSVSANIEEGYGRGFGKEYPQFLRYSRGSARESKGRYRRCIPLLSDRVVNERIGLLDEIIAMETKTIETLENKNKAK
ncbi:MAG TPA: four helix bundle protein [Chitinophagales bacterium]|nr:four helix bundle protein [Chitinophagales bacterium]